MSALARIQPVTIALHTVMIGRGDIYPSCTEIISPSSSIVFLQCIASRTRNSPSKRPQETNQSDPIGPLHPALTESFDHDLSVTLFNHILFSYIGRRCTFSTGHEPLDKDEHEPRSRTYGDEYLKDGSFRCPISDSRCRKALCKKRLHCEVSAAASIQVAGLQMCTYEALTLGIHS